jgi:hypothetical protein
MVTNMLALSIDYSDVQRIMKNLGAAADQIPYAMALALNVATERTRQHLIKRTWPGHVHQRNASFIAASLTTKEARASKTSLSTEIYDRLGRGHLMMQAKGGTRVPRGGGSIAVPVSSIPRGARGVPQRLRPKNLPRSVRIKDALYTRDRKGKLKLQYVLKRATRIPKRVPFFEDYRAVMTIALNRAIPEAIAKAMSTRR